MLAFEDFIPGSVTPYGGLTVDRDAMVGFAERFDPQPMHLHEEAAAGTMAGGLIASGWYTAALNMRMMADSFLNDAHSMGSPGIAELQWLRPVRAGDRLTGLRHVLDRRPSASKPDRGFVNFRFELMNQHGETVLRQTNLIMFGRRDRDPVPDSAAQSFAADEPPIPPLKTVEHVGLPAFEELIIGERHELGEVAFPAEEIVRFARDFDPQPFHLDEAAARASHFGGLVASGWHTAAAWMGATARHRARAQHVLAAAAAPAPQLGPSPGFRNLRWLRPVRAADVIRYSTAVIDKRLSRSRPGWGLVTHLNEGVNQQGELVFRFVGSVFWEAQTKG